MKRDVQLALMADGRERGVGPLPKSVAFGNNAQLIASIAPVYLTGSVLDATYGEGMWWTRWRPEQLVAHDLERDGVDFRDLPYEARSFDAVCFDPPYVPRHGDTQATTHRDREFRRRYGLVVSRTEAELWQLIADGLAECARVSARWLLVKCTDYANGRQFIVGHHRVLVLADLLGIRCHDLIVHASGSGPGGGDIHVVRRARRAHSYLLVFDTRPMHRAAAREVAR